MPLGKSVSWSVMDAEYARAAPAARRNPYDHAMSRTLVARYRALGDEKVLGKYVADES